MARYQDKFALNPHDIALIESALRREIARCSIKSDGHAASFAERREVHSLNELLGKIHNQKIFYSQVKHSGVPAG